MTLDWSRAAVLSTTEFEVCWEFLRLGETPWQLDPPRSGLTALERDTIVTGAFVDMRRRGLAGADEPRPDIVDRMRMLARPEWSADVRFRADTLVAGVVACVGRRCTLAVRHGNEIALLALASEDALRALLELVGVTEPGRGPQLRLLAATVVPDATSAAELVNGGMAADDAAALAAACRGIVLAGQLGAAASTGDGSRVRRAPHVIGFHRGDAGTFSTIRRGDVVTVAPTGRDGLLAELADLVAAVR
ncbi:ESX secretion-associated protein EspG [Pseudonocardia sp. GCM10023141]|uniref:ESX secretion-associated protein EspG n=1 Tax=Pseudonocardia sp. GCM10023141 TaxID=3252653 RepID=UPI003608BD3E